MFVAVVLAAVVLMYDIDRDCFCALHDFKTGSVSTAWSRILRQPACAQCCYVCANDCYGLGQFAQQEPSARTCCAYSSTLAVRTSKLAVAFDISVEFVAFSLCIICGCLSDLVHCYQRGVQAS
jgi:hypothetical protein